MSDLPQFGGGPAFPVPNDANVNGQQGMTLRDYFAGQALAGMWTQPAAANGWSDGQIAEWAYASADAMIEERNK